MDLDEQDNRHLNNQRVDLRAVPTLKRLPGPGRGYRARFRLISSLGAPSPGALSQLLLQAAAASLDLPHPSAISS
jgi:hypothetical protein